MSEKRRDSKNRILRTGESQEADGRYKYRYIDANGKRKTVYSWRLVATDSIPAGKKDNAPLRDQEKAINKDLDDMIVPDGGGLTVLQLCLLYTSRPLSIEVQVLMTSLLSLMTFWQVRFTRADGKHF